MRTEQIAFLLNRRRRRSQHKDKSPLQTGRRVFVFLGAGLSLFLVAGLLVTGFFFAGLTEDLPSLAALPELLDLEEGQLLQPTRMYDRTGQDLLVTLENPGIQRRFLPVDPQAPEHLSPLLVQIAIGLHDPTFWQHPGFAYWDLASPQPETIAEKLVDALLLEEEPPGLRKTVRMRILAGQVVARYGRARVLEWFLNSAYFGHVAYGADNAAWLYLGKPASQLDLAESALLAGVMETPSLNPLDAPNGARDQQRAILSRLLSLGMINQQEYETARAVDLQFQPPPPQIENEAPAFTRLALEQLSQSLGRRRVERGGLRVITTLDIDFQRQLACTARLQLQRLQGGEEGTPPEDCAAGRLLPTLPPAGRALPDGLKTSAVVLDVRSGQVVALLGDTTSRGEQSSLAEHPPGSLLSPFVALAGFSRGMSPASLVWDIPSEDTGEVAGRTNPDGTFHGPQRLRMAVANDYLVPLTKLLVQIGPETAWRLAEPLGLAGLAGTEDPVGLLFGGGSVSPLSVAQTYGTIAALGYQNGIIETAEGAYQPEMVLAVEDLSGRGLVDSQAAAGKAVLSPPLAYLVHSILSDEQARWPSLGYPNPLEIGRPVGARIGRTAAGNDLWTVGYTPSYLAVVWMGMPEGAPPVPLDFRMPSGIWHAFMQYAHKSRPVETWEIPPGVATLQVCDPSGMLPAAGCPNTVSEVFLSGTEPTEVDTLYRKVQINRETGLLATVFTPLELIEDRLYMFAPAAAQEWARTAGLAIPPTDYDTIQVPAQLPDVNITGPKIFSYVRDQVEVTGTAAGDGFVSYRVQIGEGLNPRTWIQLGNEETKPVTSGTLARWNTLGQEGLFAVQLLVVRADQQIESAVIQVTVDNTPPEGSIIYPPAGEKIALAGDRPVTFQAQAGDNIGVSRVEWYVDGDKAGETARQPWVLAWKPQPGQHVLTARVIDLAGNSADTPGVEFVVE